jgi:hypothetical protein
MLHVSALAGSRFELLFIGGVLTFEMLPEEINYLN